MKKDDLKSVSWTMDKNIDNTFYDYPSLADVDNDDKQEIVTYHSSIKNFDRGVLFGI